MPHVEIAIDDVVQAWLEGKVERFGDTPNTVLRRMMERERGAETQAAVGPTDSPGGVRSAGRMQMVHTLSKQLAEMIENDLRRRTGDASIKVRWRRVNPNASITCDKGRIADLNSFRPRKSRAGIEFLEDLLRKAGIPLNFDHQWDHGNGLDRPSHLHYIPHNGQDWDRAKYDQAIDLLVRIWQVR